MMISLLNCLVTPPEPKGVDIYGLWISNFVEHRASPFAWSYPRIPLLSFIAFDPVLYGQKYVFDPQFKRKQEASYNKLFTIENPKMDEHFKNGLIEEREKESYIKCFAAVKCLFVHS